jgi:hypothetical protein
MFGEVYAQMGIGQYLAEKQERLDKSKNRIRNFQVFDFNYIPEKPLMREKAKPIIDSLNPLSIKEKIHQNLAI